VERSRIAQVKGTTWVKNNAYQRPVFEIHIAEILAGSLDGHTER
jgi:hypothetical protein